MTRRALLTFAAAFVADKRDVASIVGEIGKCDKAYNDLHELAAKRAKFFSPYKDAAILGWLRKAAQVSRKVADAHDELIERLSE